MGYSSYYNYDNNLYVKLKNFLYDMSRIKGYKKIEQLTKETS